MNRFALVVVVFVAAAAPVVADVAPGPNRHHRREAPVRAAPDAGSEAARDFLATTFAGLFAAVAVVLGGLWVVRRRRPRAS